MTGSCIGSWSVRVRRFQETVAAIDTIYKDIIETCYGEMSAIEYMKLAEIASITQPDGWVIEIGAKEGKSTAILAAASKANNLGKVVSIDHDMSVVQHLMPPPRDYSYGIPRMLGYSANLFRYCIEDYVVTILSDSRDASEVLNVEARLLFIDGGHGHTQAAQDIACFTPFLKIGGHIAVHDYGGPEVGVTRAVDDHIIGCAMFRDVGQVGSLVCAIKHQ